MTRLQKKCVIATVGFHLLLLVILFLGPAFFWHKPEPDALPMLKVIPLNAVEAALTSGSASPQPPPPVQPQQQPPTPVPPTPTPPPPVPQPVVAPPTPAPEPVHQVEPKPEETPTPDETPSIEPSPVPRPRPKHTIDVDLTPVHSASHPTHHTDTTARDQEREAQQEEREARAEARRRAEALHSLTSSLENNLSSSTDVQLPGTSSQSFANYGQIVKSIYYNNWITPDNATDENASPKVRVVIGRDGSVISAQIIEPSGDSAVDDSVKRLLDRVTFIQAFPDGATESQRSFTLRFNLKAKRMLE